MQGVCLRAERERVAYTSSCIAINFDPRAGGAKVQSNEAPVPR